MVHIHNRILLNRKKVWIWVSWAEVGEPRAYYMEWGKSEREKQIYINAYVWNLGGKWHRWSYLQTINRDKCREQMYGHQRGKGKWDELGDWDWHIYPTMYKIGN